jgi:peptide/nickel transport system permease protein
MWYYAARRIFMTIPIALGVSAICYGLILLVPGDPIQSMLPPDATPEEVAYLRKAYGFDRPVPVQYLLWLQRALSGDLGASIQTHRPVVVEVMSALSNTFVISVGAVSLAFSLAFVLGNIAA